MQFCVQNEFLEYERESYVEDTNDEEKVLERVLNESLKEELIRQASKGDSQSEEDLDILIGK